MYEHTPIQDQLTGAQEADKKYINRYGVYVYVDVDPDWTGPDFFIDQADTEGITIFREFAAKMAEHYKTLLK